MFCFFRTFTRIFLSNSVGFVDGKCKNVSCLRVQRIPATPLDTSDTDTDKPQF